MPDTVLNPGDRALPACEGGTGRDQQSQQSALFHLETLTGCCQRRRAGGHRRGVHSGGFVRVSHTSGQARGAQCFMAEGVVGTDVSLGGH